MLSILTLCIFLYLNIYLIYLILRSTRSKIIYKAKNKTLEINSKYIDIKNKGILDECPLLNYNLNSFIQTTNEELIIGNKTYKKSNTDEKELHNEFKKLAKEERRLIIDFMSDIFYVNLMIIKIKHPILYIRRFFKDDIILKFLKVYNYISKKIGNTAIIYKSKFIKNIEFIKENKVYNSMKNVILYNNIIK